MGWLLDGIYAGGLLLGAPWLLASSHRRRLLPTRLLGRGLPQRPPGKVVWFHGVSVGEIILLETLLREFTKSRPDLSCMVSCSTDTGMAEALKRHSGYSPFPFPFDFSFAVNRALDKLRPDLVILAESELWPNFLGAVHKRKIPLAVINARMSPRSLRRWQMVAPLVRGLFRKVDQWAVQQPEHAAALGQLGVDASRLHVTGSVKFDHAGHPVDAAKIEGLREYLNLQSHEILWVVGSTQPPEERICMDAFVQLKKDHPALRMAIVPRDPSRGADIAAQGKLLGFACPRRSLGQPVSKGEPVAILDTIGELGALWNLAKLAFVGGSLDGKRGGQNMIEPAALGLVPVFGPHVWNFQAIANALVVGEMAAKVFSPQELLGAFQEQLRFPDRLKVRGEKAKEFVASQHGATCRTVAMLSAMIPPVDPPSRVN